MKELIPNNPNAVVEALPMVLTILSYLSKVSRQSILACLPFAFTCTILQIGAAPAIHGQEFVQPSTVLGSSATNWNSGIQAASPGEVYENFFSGGQVSQSQGLAQNQPVFESDVVGGSFGEGQSMRLGVRVDFLNFSRSGGTDDSAFVFDADTDEVLLRHSDLESDSETAGRIRIQYQTQDGTGYEFGYFDFDSFTGNISVTNAYTLLFGGIPSAIADGYDITYSTQLKNYEFNTFLRKNSWLRCGVGLRHVDLREEFNSVVTGSSGVSSSGTGLFGDTDNDLFGAQVIADVYLPVTSGLQLEAGVRAGGFYNNVDVRFDSLNRDLHYEDDQFSTVVDLNVGLVWNATNYMTFRGGYQAMLLGSVALAPNQSTDFDFFATSAPAKFSDVTFDGGYFGVELRF